MKESIRSAFKGLACAVLASAALMSTAASAASAVKPPVMGWASWNSFASSIDYWTIKRQVDALVDSGLAASGYVYVNLDDGWWQGQRDASGNMVVDTNLWPGGIEAIVNYIHSKGLKAGTYTDAGRNGCGYYFPTTRPAAPNTGLEGHVYQDILQFQRWGFDFVKVDWCGGAAEGLDPKSAYQEISDAIKAATAVTGREMVLSICNWGRNGPWFWGPGMAPMWRTSGDIIFWGQRASTGAMLANFTAGIHPTAQHTGYVNDPDMMMVGMPGLTDAQNRLHLSLWAISGAPLLLGNDLTTLTPPVTAMLRNRLMLSINQDARGLQGVKVAEDAPGLQVYSKVLSGTGRRAVLLLNRTNTAANISVRWADLGLTSRATQVRDVWTGEIKGSPANGTTVTVPATDAVLLLVAGAESASVLYEAEAAANAVSGTAATAACSGCSGGAGVRWVGNGATLSINNVRSATAGLKVVDIRYINGDAVDRVATLQVNSQMPTTLAFPPTGSWTTARTVSVIVSLQQGGLNQLGFSNPQAFGPDFDAIRVRDMPGAKALSLVGVGSQRCADVPAYGGEGSQLTLWECHGGTNQGFSLTPQGELVTEGDRCLDNFNNSTANGTPLIVWACNGQANQRWRINADGSIVNQSTGLCLDADNNGTVNGTKLQMWTCNGGANQRWQLN